LLLRARAENLAADEFQPFELPGLSRRFDILHAHDARAHTHAALFSRIPFVVSRRVAFPVRTGLLSRWKYRVPALFLAVSNFVAAQLRAAGVSGDRIVVVYDGIPVPPEPAQGETLLTPYTTDAAKGMTLAHEAAALAGLTLDDSRDLEADLPTARLLLYLTQSEGLGSGILLGMAHGVTVVASNAGGIPELIEDGVNGLLTANQPQAVADALRQALSSSPRQFGEAARQTVLQRFTERHMLHATLAAYLQVLNV
jgi:glycosyltransferase involved in cell wall biosynthesis